MDPPSKPGGKKSYAGVHRLIVGAVGVMAIFFYVMVMPHGVDKTMHGCHDLRADCKPLVQEGKCKTDRTDMMKNCVKSCGMCGHHHANCVDKNPNCPQWEAAGECKNNPVFMVQNCQRACGTCITCLSITTPDFFDTLSISDVVSFGRPVFGSSKHIMQKEKDGLWTISDHSTSTPIFRMSSPTTDPTGDENTVWMQYLGAKWTPAGDFVIEEANCNLAKKVTLPDQVKNQAKDFVPVQGVDFEASYDAAHLEPADESYDYPKDGSAAFQYPEDIKPQLGIPFHILSYKPRIYYFPRFLSDEESDNIKDEASKRLQRSGVVPIKGKKSTGIDKVRTSFGCWLDNSHKSVEDVRRRILSVTGFNTTQVEKLQVLRYEIGGKYESHHDFYQPHGAKSAEEAEEMWRNKWNKNWNRAATFFLYLHDTEEGGETVLPRANGGPQPASMRDCTKGLRVKPKRGSAVLFYDMKPNHQTDDYSLHGGCPVVKGVKWAAPQWLHVKVREDGQEDNFW